MSRNQMIKLLKSSAAALSSLEQASPSPTPENDTGGAQAKLNILQLIEQILEAILAEQPIAGQTAAALQQENTDLFHAVTDILSTIHIENAKNSTAPAVDIGGIQINILQLIIQVIQAILAQNAAAPTAPPASSADKPCPCAIKAAVAEPDAIRPLLTSDSVIYAYDTLGRLMSLTFANGTTVVYNYDSSGNRTSVVTTCSGGGC